MIAALLASLSAQALPAYPQATACVLCDPQQLQPYFEKLARTGRDRRRVHILQVGDSHTAGDQITGAWRALLQARYGNAGHGVLPPGRPYQGYLTRGVTAAASPGWTVAGVFGAAYRGAAAPPIGVSGYSLTSSVEGASLSIAADQVGFDRFTVCALARPGAGTVTLAIGDHVRTLPLAADEAEPRCLTLDAGSVAYRASLSVAGGPVTITSWSTERGGAGVVLSNLGTVGAQLVHFGRTDDRVVAAEIAQYQPDLLVVAFGTNEAFMPGFAAADYEARLRAALLRLKRLVPGVPVLLLGAPDSATRQAALQVGEGGVSLPCPAAGIAAGLDQAATDGWRPTAALAAVQAIQRRVAHAQGIAFWDWSARMGGRCAATAWATATPPLMRGDRVHFTTAGAAEIGRLLQADLDTAMAAAPAPLGAR